MFQSPRLTRPVTSRPTRVLPQGSVSVPSTTAVSVTGPVTPFMVRSPSISKVSSSSGRIEVDSKRISGFASTPKKSADRRCSSRPESFVFTDLAWIVPDARAAERSSPISSAPSNCSNWPRTVAMPRCFTEKPTVECEGSTLQVPVGIRVALAVEFMLLPYRKNYLQVQLSSHCGDRLHMAGTGRCMYLSYVSAQRGGSGAPTRANGALHVAADPLVRAAHVEGRLVRPVERPHRHHVTRPPPSDVAARPGVHAPAAHEHRQGVARRLAEGGHQLLRQLGFELRLGRREERRQPLGRHERRHDALALHPRPADHRGLEVGVAVLALLVPERVLVGEHHLRGQRVALAVERSHALVRDALHAQLAKRPDRHGGHHGLGLEALARLRRHRAALPRHADALHRRAVAHPVSQLLRHPQRDGGRALGHAFALPDLVVVEAVPAGGPPPCGAQPAATSARSTRLTAPASRGRARARRSSWRRARAASRRPTADRAARPPDATTGSSGSTLRASAPNSSESAAKLARSASSIQGKPSPT